MSIKVVNFNPLRRRSSWAGALLPRRRLNNFGDLIGPLLVNEIIKLHGLSQPVEDKRLVAVGSIMKLTKPGDIVWGAGINGKSLDPGAAPQLDVRAVRGPLTRELLMASGTQVPEIYGDPGLLWSTFWPVEHYSSHHLRDKIPVSVIPNFHDTIDTRPHHRIDPLQDPHRVAELISMSDFVCGSSLHGIVIAESFGIPARLVKSEAEPPFKYDDYYSGTGRSDYLVAHSVEEAIEMGGERPPIFSSEALLQSFPFDLYS